MKLRVAARRASEEAVSDMSPFVLCRLEPKRGQKTERINEREETNKMNERMCRQEVWGLNMVWAGIILYHNGGILYDRQLLGKVLETWEWKSGFRTRELEPQARV